MRKPACSAAAAGLDPTNPAAVRRPYLAASVAFTGAALLAVGPVTSATTTLPARAVRAAVTLSSVADPSIDWATVVTDAQQNVQQIQQEMAADPSPALTQIVANETAYGHTLDTALQDVSTGLDGFFSQQLPEAMQTAAGQLQSGDVTDALQTVLGSFLYALLFDVSVPLQPVLQIPSEMTQNLTNVLAQLPTITAEILGGDIGPWYSMATAFGDDAQAFLDAMNASDSTEALSILANAPATLTGAFINGYALENGEADYVGLLSSMSSASGPGPFDDMLVGLPQMIAQLLGAMTP